MSQTDKGVRLGVLMSTIFVTMLAVGIIVPFLPIYAQGMGASTTMMGMIFSAFSLSRLIFLPFMGHLSDRHGRKKFIILGLGGITLVSMGLLLTSSPWQLVAARGFQGAFSAMVLPITMALVADITPSGGEGKGFGSFNGAMLLGFGMGPLLGGVLYDLWGVQANFVTMGCLCLLNMFLVAWLIKEPKQLRQPVEHSSFMSQFSLLKDKELLGVCLCRAAAAMAMGFFVAFLPILGLERGLSNSQIGILMASNVLVMTVLQAPAGRLADRVARHRQAALGQFFTGLFKALLPLTAGFEGLLLFIVLEGVSAGCGFPALTALAVDHGRRLDAGMGRVMSIFTMALSFGVFFGPMLGGILADVIGIENTFYIAGGVASLGSLALKPWAPATVKAAAKGEQVPKTVGRGL